VTNPDDHVPDSVLDELSAAFAEGDAADRRAVTYDFDDPSIDRLLGLGPEPDEESDEEPDVDEFDDVEPEEEPGVDDEAEVYPAPGPGPEPEQTREAVAEPVAGPETEPARSRRTIVIDHEEQPDTVYLDEQLDEQRRGDGTRSTVVIDDLDDGVVAEPAPTAGHGGPSPAMDPRMRARRIATKRAEGRRRLVVVGIIAAVVLLLVGAIAVVASPIFDVREVRVQGAVYTDADVLAEVVASLEGEPVLLVDTEAAERRLAEVPWVERVTVSTDFPHTVVVDIRERRPVATFQGSDQLFRVIDVQGRVLDVIDGRPVAYPLVTGRHPDTPRGQYAGAPYAAAGRLVLALPPEIRSLLIDMGLDSGTGLLSLQLRGPDDRVVEVRLGDESALDDKLARLLQRVRLGLEDTCGLDVSTAEVGLVKC